jgi:hypothetical protein
MADLPKIAMQRLHEKAAAAGSHPDPNLISAFAENSLSGDERAQVLQHIAQCADCREVVFLSSPDQAATLPATASSASNWLSWPVLRWSAAVAAVVVVFAAVSQHRQSGSRAMRSDAILRSDAPNAKEKATSTPPAEQKPDVALMAKTASAPPVTANGAVGGAEGTRLDQLKKQNSRVAASPRVAQRSEALGDKVAGEARDAAAPTQTTETVEVTAQSVPVESGQVVPGRAKDADAAAEPVSNMGAGMGAGVAPNAAAASRSRPAMFMPTVAPRWTLTSDGTLQRSLDFGRSWQTVQVASLASFRALAANGKDIWVGGLKGALYHSMDAGQNWAQVQPVAAGLALTDDIIGVEFPDVLHGKLTTSNKETWTTQDGGQSWNKQ